MVVVLPAVERRPSFGERLNVGISRGLDAAEQMMNQHQQRQQEDQADRVIESLTGQSVKGMPLELKKVFLSEVLKNQSKETLFDRKEKFLNQILGGQGERRQSRLMQSVMQENDQNGGIAPQNEMSPSMDGFDPSQLSDADIAQASFIDPNFGRALMHAKDVALRESRSEREFAHRQQESERSEKRQKAEFAYKRAAKVLDSAEKTRESLPVREASLNAMRDAIETGNLDFFSLDNLAERTGLDVFRTAAGGQFKAAGKNFLVSNVSKFGARPNQYIEMQVAEMLPKIGRSREANLAALEMMQFEKDIDEERVKTIDALEDLYETELGYVPANIGKEVDKRMKSYVERRQKDLVDRLKQLESDEKRGAKPEKGFVRMLSPDGEVWDIPAKDMKQAIKDGWIKQ